VGFNWGLARVTANLSQREAEKSYGITGDDLTPGGTSRLRGTMSWSLFPRKREVPPSLRKDWGDCRKGKRKGKAVGFPGSRRAARPARRSGTRPARSGASPAMRCYRGSAR
jgi:hypothetical protein